MEADIINIGYREYARFFNLEEARALLPLIKKITHETYSALDPLRRELRAMSIVDDMSPQLELDYKRGVEDWIEKMNRLGVIPVTLGMVNFDTGDGYLNWKYPEVDLSHYHDYDSHYKDRKPLERVMLQQSPDWAS